jgi:Arc/MetJ-type ribon-helix-helix transcriptional regulator
VTTCHYGERDDHIENPTVIDSAVLSLVWWLRSSEPLKFRGDAKMAVISVEVPQELREFIDANIRHGKFSSVNDYIVALVESARDGRSAIEAALLDGIESGPAEEWTKDEWAGIKQRVAERHQGR